MSDILIKILVIIAIIGIPIGLTYLAIYLKKKNIIKQEDINNAVDMISITMAIAKELGFDDPMIRQISVCTVQALNYVKLEMKTDNSDEKIKLAIGYSKQLMTNMHIEITKEREDILTKLITVGLNIK